MWIGKGIVELKGVVDVAKIGPATRGPEAEKPKQ
jgi:hypothetical protein